jgi:hypothetical protein
VETVEIRERVMKFKEMLNEGIVERYGMLIAL